MEKYKLAGVDVAKTDRLAEKISGIVENIGGFGGLYDLGENYLVASTDGVGTKILLAQEYDMLDGIGIDCVAMCVNDIICSGARPLFFLDYFASANIEEKQYLAILNSIKRGCEIANMPLIGGETAELPTLLADKHFDVAGFCVGIVKKEELIDGSDIEKGDVVLGLPSNGFHSNGYSLIRKVFDKQIFEPYIDALLKPTEIYVSKVLNRLKKGIKRKLMGVKIDLDEIEMMEERPLQNGKSLLGYLRSAVYSPHFKKVVGIAMIKKEYWDKKTTFELKIGNKKSMGSICDLPLV
mgnify:CR=1 FL=1